MSRPFHFGPSYDPVPPLSVTGLQHLPESGVGYPKAKGEGDGVKVP